VRAVREFEANIYLSSELPALLGAATTPAVPKSAIIQWVVVDRADCDFVYRISEEGVAVSSEIADDADLTVSFVSADLRDFSEHKLDVARALRTKRLKITGDENLLAWMAERLAVVASGSERVR
jgi:hypothetical protein